MLLYKLNFTTLKQKGENYVRFCERKSSLGQYS